MTPGAAFEPGATLITLIDLMFEFEIGVQKRRVELLEGEPSALAEPQDPDSKKD